jgi:hypothetical protein
MTKFVATLTLEAPTANAAVQTLSLKAVNADDTLFDYPLTRTLIETLEERND